MQNELTALRPQLLETSDETERLMIKIEQDTIQVKSIMKRVIRSQSSRI
jgi:dynein heavy chain